MWIAHDFRRGDFFGSIPSSRCQTTRAPTLTGRSRRRMARETCFLRTSVDPAGGARRDRTDDLLLAKQALSQLSYGPNQRTEDRRRTTDIRPLSSVFCRLETGGPG